MKPLEGIKILDLSHMLSGPTCTAMLALLGAEVVKVERPVTGDGFRHYTEHAGKAGMSVPFAAANVGKKSITIDMKKPESAEIIRRLAETSDVVVENFRPGVPESLGLDWKSLKAINPRLVYCSITGFGHTGPLRDWTALDQIIQAMSGVVWLNGEPDDGPVKIGFPVMDTFTGYMADIAILAALRRRDITGVGEFIDVSMLDCAMKMMAGPVATHLYTGELPKRTGNRGYRSVATADLYKTADGYLMLGANLQHHYVKFCKAMNAEHMLTDPRFATIEARVANNTDLRDALTALMQNVNSAETEAKLAAAEVPVAMVRTLADITKHEQFADRSTILEADLPEHDKPLRLVGPGFELEGDKLTPGHVPYLGENTDQVLADLGYDAAAIAELHAKAVV